MSREKAVCAIPREEKQSWAGVEPGHLPGTGELRSRDEVFIGLNSVENGEFKN